LKDEWSDKLREMKENGRWGALQKRRKNKNIKRKEKAKKREK